MAEGRWVLPETGSPVAYRAGQTISRTAFRGELAAARRALAGLDPGHAAHRPGFALFEPDACRFAVWLLAGWSLGFTVVLPGDDLPVTREALPMPWVGAGDAENALASWAGEEGEEEDVKVDHGHPGAMSFTSGSTGKPLLIEKSLSQLRAEAKMLERSFGGELTPDTRFVASVPHQHMYGLPFFLLWPLAAGRPFVVEKLRYPEDVHRLPPADYVLVSAPTFLKHLPDSPRSSGARWKMATSAGSPLAPEVARAAGACLRAPVHEIYGSTETGAVARRTVGAPWQPMPGVRLALEEPSSRLRIHSPLLSGSERTSGFLSGDLARLDEHGLELLGRADRLVKIGEKRISPEQVERELARLPEVVEARVLPLPGAQGERVVLGAVVVLRPEGRQKLAAEKKTRFGASLRARLAGRLDPLAMPRRWRYVEAFPANEMGKTTQGDLKRLFASEFPLVEEIPGAAGVALLLRLPADLVWFEGHFPDLPVLPGVVQIDWAAHYGRLYLGFDATAADVSRLKFQNLIRPGDSMRLELLPRRGGSELEFRYTLEGKPCSHGTLVAKKLASTP